MDWIVEPFLEDREGDSSQLQQKKLALCLLLGQWGISVSVIGWKEGLEWESV